MILSNILDEITRLQVHLNSQVKTQKLGVSITREECGQSGQTKVGTSTPDDFKVGTPQQEKGEYDENKTV